jgi:hypothetical protein
MFVGKTIPRVAFDLGVCGSGGLPEAARCLMLRSQEGF